MWSDPCLMSCSVRWSDQTCDLAMTALEATSPDENLENGAHFAQCKQCKQCKQSTPQTLVLNRLCRQRLAAGILISRIECPAPLHLHRTLNSEHCSTQLSSTALSSELQLELWSGTPIGIPLHKTLHSVPSHLSARKAWLPFCPNHWATISHFVGSFPPIFFSPHFQLPGFLFKILRLFSRPLNQKSWTHCKMFCFGVICILSEVRWPLHPPQCIAFSPFPLLTTFHFHSSYH